MPLPCNGTTESTGGHWVQFYGSDHTLLIRNAARHLATGLMSGEPALVIATESHIKQLQKLLSPGPGQTISYIDAWETLSKFMVGGLPEWERFQVALSQAILPLRQKARGAGIRAFGEMAGLLWSTGQHAAAIRLEQFGNRVLHRSRIKMYCSYAIDILDSGFHPTLLDGILCNHTHVLPASGSGFDRFVLGAIDDFLGDKTPILRRAIAQNKTRWAVIPKTEALILAFRNEAPKQAGHILQIASLRFKESVEP